MRISTTPVEPRAPAPERAQRERASGGHPWRMGRFPQLMPQRVGEILLVSSPYDSFILEEDGLLTELIYSEYADLGLSHAPNVTRVPTAGAALSMIRRRKFDLVIAMTRLGDMDVAAFRQTVLERSPDTPIVLLVGSELELQQHIEETPDFDTLDAYVWHGDAKLFLAIIKMFEDRWNVAHDTQAAGVGAIILVEDSVQFRSLILPILYSELVQQARTVIADGINRMHKLLRLRARPKILVANTFERGVDYFDAYREYLFGVIADVRFPRGDELDPCAGIEFIRRLKGEYPDLPALLQSSDETNRTVAESIGARFLHKRSPKLLQDIRDFMLANFGFGAFTFRLPDGREVARATDLRSMLRALAHAPAPAIEYHARRNHFSNWLRARTEFELAAQIRPRQVGEFGDIEGLRDYLRSALEDALRRNRRGVTEDFSRQQFDEATHFARIGGGSLGGKARGLAFVEALLARHKVDTAFDNVQIFVPRSVVIGADVFDEFMQSNRLWSVIEEAPPDEMVRRRFCGAELPARVIKDLHTFLHKVRTPIAVRSSSLLEDSQHHPFAGIYGTFMLPNNHDSARVRLQQLNAAIKRVYASVYEEQARRYIANTPYRIEEQRMAVVIQPIVGRERGGYFYPSIAGAARSYNYYPFGAMTPEDGIAAAALGLGGFVLDGGAALRFCPTHPQVLPQLREPEDFINQSQRTFFAIDLSNPDVDFSDPAVKSQVELDLDDAEEHGALAPIGSVWQADNNAIYDGIHRPGVRVVTFAHVLKSEVFPLAPILRRLLKIGRAGMNGPVDVEFAANLDTQPAEFAVLQIRPCNTGADAGEVDLHGLPESLMLCDSPKAMGNGVIGGVQDIIYVRPDTFDPAHTQDIAEQIGRLNTRLVDERRKCVLLGPGRWGSSNQWLGIPVSWPQISTARVIIETALDDFVVDPSQGSHFFHNITAFGVAYLAVNPAHGEGRLDWDWLQAQPVVDETELVRLVRLESPLEVRVDGRISRAVVLKRAWRPGDD